ncbi:hypothetical protein RHSIM_Rhsim06G0044000 [Rhododendron simsii]|uniref:Uncharacterized protein n=1 Tax=Rhododendron simsii TaxID=118357 RepID=A0A834LM64_RHOSS|nr:hypothetical protein RHSIM_Rhsim06G0044000 [Rhododendron simsii]
MESSTTSVSRSDPLVSDKRRSRVLDTRRRHTTRRGGNTILHFLAVHGNASVVQKLVDDDNGNNNSSSSIVKCEDLFGRNDKGNTALHEAARFGQKSVVEILLRKQESLVLDRDREVTRSSDNSNILHAAVMEEHYRT